MNSRPEIPCLKKSKEQTKQNKKPAHLTDYWIHPSAIITIKSTLSSWQNNDDSNNNLNGLELTAMPVTESLRWVT